MVTVITFGTVDLLHIGHINIINKCRSYGDRLVVGVSSDELNYRKNINILCIVNQTECLS